MYKFFLILSLSFLANAMTNINLPLEIICKISEHVIYDYYNQITYNQNKIQKAFTAHPAIFKTSDVWLFFPKSPQIASINKGWHKVFTGKHIQYLKLLLSKQEVVNKKPLRFVCRSNDFFNKESIEYILYINPWIYVSKRHLEADINANDKMNPQQKKRRIEHLGKSIQQYKALCANLNDNNKLKSFNLLVLTALDLIDYSIVNSQRYIKFFYQLFFNCPLNMAFKRSFFDYLIMHYPDNSMINYIIKTALNSANFRINNENKSFWIWYEKFHKICLLLKNKILMKIGFNQKIIEAQKQRKSQLLDCLESNFEQCIATFFLPCYYKSIKDDQWYLLEYVTQKFDRKLSLKNNSKILIKKAMKLLNWIVFFYQKNHSTEASSLSHEEVSEKLAFKNYNHLYKRTCDSIFQNDQINPNYSFRKTSQYELGIVKNPSLLMIKLLFSPLENFLYHFNLLSKVERKEKYSHSTITNNTIIILLLKKYFEQTSSSSDQIKRKVLSVFQLLFKPSKGLAQMILQSPDLLKNLKEEYARIVSKYHSKIAKWGEDNPKTLDYQQKKYWLEQWCPDLQ